MTEWALRNVDAPVAVARYTTGDVVLTETPPAEMKPALRTCPHSLAIVVSEAIVPDELQGGVQIGVQFEGNR